jgi:hypothetical protein
MQEKPLDDTVLVSGRGFVVERGAISSASVVRAGAELR